MSMLDGLTAVEIYGHDAWDDLRVGELQLAWANANITARGDLRYTDLESIRGMFEALDRWLRAELRARLGLEARAPGPLPRPVDLAMSLGRYGAYDGMLHHSGDGRARVAERWCGFDLAAWRSDETGRYDWTADLGRRRVAQGEGCGTAALALNMARMLAGFWLESLPEGVTVDGGAGDRQCAADDRTAGAGGGGGRGDGSPARAGGPRSGQFGAGGAGAAGDVCGGLRPVRAGDARTLQAEQEQADPVQ